MGRLEGRIAVITGAGRGIGRATAVRFAEEGARVAVNDVDVEAAGETAARIAELGGQSRTFVGDTIHLAYAREMLTAVADEYGGVDILINNAGITRDRMFHNLDDEQWDFVLDVNLRTAFHCTLAAMPFMREAAKREQAEQGVAARHRKITFTTSSIALFGNPGQANYAAAKGALISLTRTLARELGPFWINVNAVAPGFIETRLTAPKEEGSELGIPDHIRQMALATIALGRAGRPEDVANAHVFLASEEADYVTGAILPVAGGQMGT